MAIKGFSATKRSKFDKNISKLSPKILDVFRKRKLSTAELKRARVHELKLFRLKHRQKMDVLRQQQEQIAIQQDPRFSQDFTEEQFLNEPQMEAPQEEYYNENENYSPQKVGVGQRILSGLQQFGRGLNNMGGLRSRHNPVQAQNIRQYPKEIKREIARRNNILNASKSEGAPKLIPSGTWINENKITLMGSERTNPKAQRLNFWKS